MYIIYWFPVAPVAFGILILILALVGPLFEILPIIEVLIWIVFALYCLVALYWAITSDATGYVRKGLCVIANIASCILIGISTHSFFQGLYASYGDGMLTGTIEFLAMLLFGGVWWFICLFCFAWAGLNLSEATDRNFGRRIVGSILLFLVLFML